MALIFKQTDKILNGEKTQTRRVIKSGEFAANAIGLWIPNSVLNEHNERYRDLWDRTNPHRTSDYGTRIMTPSSRTKWQIGCQYAIVPKRGGAGIGRYIRITNIRYEHLHDITEQDACAEGVASVAEYRELWQAINGNKKGCRWGDNPEVWVLEFELVQE